jgi:Fe-S cluster biogenesis protein NfuA
MAEILENALDREKVEAALDKIRPHLQADGGDIKLIGVKDGEVTVKLTGACAGCPMSTMTLRAGVERVLRQELPEMKKLVAV